MLKGVFHSFIHYFHVHLWSMSVNIMALVYVYGIRELWQYIPTVYGNAKIGSSWNFFIVLFLI